MVKAYYEYDMDDENYTIFVNFDGKEILLDIVEFAKLGEDPKELTEKIVSEMNESLKNLGASVDDIEDVDEFARILEKVYQKLGIDRPYTSEI